MKSAMRRGRVKSRFRGEGAIGKRSSPWLIVVCASAACVAPISTLRSPMHPRVIEFRNDTDRELVLTIEPTADQHLAGATTFRGRFTPGVGKTLYLYHGVRYRVSVLEPGGEQIAAEIYEVDEDLGIAFGGTSLRRQAPRKRSRA